ncbi:hypothetical protein RCC89_05840 [Cytophagaceae bacterium ABcell3]|nr:hypothetical protein RCC89_05840 [Cytophagaceae bacterium ABcell3]
MSQKIFSSGTYRTYKQDQVLTDKQLNESIAFFESQDRQSRVFLHGVGIVNGFEIYWSGNDTIKLKQGVGITTDGDLIVLKDDKGLVSELEFSYYRPFDDDKARYPKFKDLELFELIPEDKRQNNDEQLVQSQWSDFIAVLYLESYGRDPDLCAGINCDNQGTEQVANLKILVCKEGIDKIISSVHHDDFRNDPTIHELNKIRLKRVSFSSLGSGEEAHVEGKLRKAYEEVVNEDILGKLSQEVRVVLERFREGHDVNLLKIKEEIEANYGFQYFYDYVKDIIDTFHEIKALARELLPVSLPSVDAFPKHLLLGKMSNELDSYDYRHRFYPAPTTDSVQRYNKCKSLVKRLRLQLQLFSFSTLKGTERATLRENLQRGILINKIPSINLIDNVRIDFNLDQKIPPFHRPVQRNEVDLGGLGGSDVRITPSQLRGKLGDRAIPFYYNLLVSDYGDLLREHWNFSKTRHNEQYEVYSYYRDTYPEGDPGNAPLEYDLDPYDFFRIEGHQGKSLDEVLVTIRQQVKDYNLDFDVKPLALEASSISDINTDDFKSYFGDLELSFSLWKKDIKCILDNAINFFDEIQLNVKEDIEEGDKEEDEEGGGGLIDYKKPIFTIPMADARFEEYPRRSIDSVNVLEKDLKNIGAVRDGGQEFVGSTTKDFKIASEKLIRQEGHEEGEGVLDFSDKNVLVSRLKENQLGSIRQVVKESSNVRELLNSDIYNKYFSGLSKEERRVINAALAIVDVLEALKTYVSEKLKNLTDIDLKAYGDKLQSINDELSSFLALAETSEISEAEKSYLRAKVSYYLTVGCSMETLGVLATEVEKREQKALSQLNFLSFIKNNPGAEHHAGVSRGGTFILVYNKDGVVVADFMVPWRCCSEGMPVNFVFQLPEPKPHLSFDRNVYCLGGDDEREITFDVYPLDGDVRPQGELDGVVIEGNSLKIDSDVFPEDRLGEPVSFTVNGQNVDAILVVYKLPDFEIKLEQAVVGKALKVKAELGSDYNIAGLIFVWNFGEITQTGVDVVVPFERLKLDENFSLRAALVVYQEEMGCSYRKEATIDFAHLILDRHIYCLGSDNEQEISFEVYPSDGNVKPEGGLNGVVIEKNNLKIDPKTFPEDRLGTPVSFTVNGKSVDATLTVYKLPDVKIKVEQAIVGSDLKVMAEGLSDYDADKLTLIWDFGHEVKAEGGRVSVPFDKLKLGEEGSLSVKLTVQGEKSGCLNTKELDVYFNDVSLELKPNVLCYGSEVGIMVDVNPSNGEIVPEGVDDYKIKDGVLTFNWDAFPEDKLREPISFKVNGQPVNEKLTVYPLPQFKLELPVNPVAGTDIEVASSPVYENADYLWELGEITSTEKRPTISYRQLGAVNNELNVELTINEHGCATTEKGQIVFQEVYLEMQQEIILGTQQQTINFDSNGQVQLKENISNISVDNVQKKISVDPSNFPNKWIGPHIRFTVNGLDVEAYLVVKAPEVPEISIDKHEFCEDDKSVPFKNVPEGMVLSGNGVVWYESGYVFDPAQVTWGDKTALEVAVIADRKQVLRLKVFKKPNVGLEYSIKDNRTYLSVFGLLEEASLYKWIVLDGNDRQLESFETNEPHLNLDISRFRGNDLIQVRVFAQISGVCRSAEGAIEIPLTEKPEERGCIEQGVTEVEKYDFRNAPKVLHRHEAFISFTSFWNKVKEGPKLFLSGEQNELVNESYMKFFDILLGLLEEGEMDKSFEPFVSDSIKMFFVLLKCQGKMPSEESNEVFGRMQIFLNWSIHQGQDLEKLIRFLEIYVKEEVQNEQALEWAYDFLEMLNTR